MDGWPTASKLEPVGCGSERGAGCVAHGLEGEPWVGAGTF